MYELQWQLISQVGFRPKTSERHIFPSELPIIDLQRSMHHLTFLPKRRSARKLSHHLAELIVRMGSNESWADLRTGPVIGPFAFPCEEVFSKTRFFVIAWTARSLGIVG